MSHQEPDDAAWESLYGAAARFFALKPWRWMLDSDIFGVKNPANGETGYCCIMGAAEEHYALAVYLGSEGLEVLKKIGLREVPTDPFGVLVMQNCLMASFEDRDMLERPDIMTIRALGLKFRGRNAWPQFRSYLPGYAPWTLTPEEAAFLTVALDQACEVAAQFRGTSEELGTRNALNNYELFLVRVPAEKAAERAWKNAMERPAPFDPPLLLPSPPDIGRIERIVATAKRTLGVLDTDYFFLPSAIKGEEDDRPWFPLVALFADDESGAILHFEMINRSELSRTFGSTLLDLAEKVRQLPAVLQVRSEQAQILLEPIAAGLGLDLKLVETLPSIEEAQQGLLDSL
jgi:hypothetical protein